MTVQEERIFRHLSSREARGATETPRRLLVNRFSSDIFFASLVDLDATLDGMVERGVLLRRETSIKANRRGGGLTVFYKTNRAPVADHYRVRRGIAQFPNDDLKDKGMVHDERLERRHLYVVAILLRLRRRTLNNPDKWMSERTLMPRIQASWKHNVGESLTPTVLRDTLHDVVMFGHAQVRSQSYPGKKDVPFYRLNPDMYL